MDQRFAVAGIDSATPLRTAAPQILLSKAQPLFDLESSASSGDDMDAAHDMRVASRRLREAMRLFAPVYRGRGFDTWLRRVRSITRALGPVRDSDVFIDAFSRLNRSLGDGGHRAVAFMIGYRSGVREDQLRSLNKTLRGLDLASGRKEFARLVRAQERSADADRPLAAFAHAAVAERSSAVYGMLPAALVESDIAMQHALRIAFKRLRYAVEVFAPCYAEEFDPLHETLTAFQDSLGDLHDLHVFLDTLREPNVVAPARKAGVSAGDMGEVEELLGQRAHAAFQRFERLAAENPAGALLPALLLPLSSAPEAAVLPESAPTLPAVTSAAGPLATMTGPSPDVEATIEPAPQVGELSQLAGVGARPPVDVGAEPWARDGEGAR